MSVRKYPAIPKIILFCLAVELEDHVYRPRQTLKKLNHLMLWAVRNSQKDFFISLSMRERNHELIVSLFTSKLMRSDSKNYTIKKYQFNPLTASPLTFTASLSKQKHSRAEFRQVRRLVARRKICYISRSTQQLYCMNFSLGEPERICNKFL